VSGRIRVVLVDDQALIRAGIRRVLEHERDLEVVAEAGDGFEMMRVLRDVEADVVVLDLNMPGRDGFEALRDLHHADFAGKVLVLSLHDDPQYVSRAVREGAHGYLLKDAAVEELPGAVRAVMEGRPFYSPKAQSCDHRGVARRPRGPGRSAVAARAGGAEAGGRGPVVQEDRRGAPHQPAHRRDAPGDADAQA
jgi:DNA-binding NarL/FixJ family response regulator